MVAPTTTTQKISVGQGVIMTAVSVIGLLIGIGVAVGVYQAKATALEGKADVLERRTEQIRSEAVTKEEFRELKGDIKEIKQEIKELNQKR